MTIFHVRELSQFRKHAEVLLSAFGTSKRPLAPSRVVEHGPLTQETSSQNQETSCDGNLGLTMQQLWPLAAAIVLLKE